MNTIHNSYPVLREAKVINTTDPEKLGRIQLKVYPELSEISDDDCPWCFPNDGGIHGKSFGVPLVGQLVNCIVWSRYWSEITFLPFVITKPTEHIFSKWMSDQKPKIKDMRSDPEEQHFVVEQFENGFSIFHDTKNNQHGVLHPSGSYILIDKEGNVFVNSENDLSILSSEMNIKTKQTGLLLLGNAVDTLGGIITELIDIVVNLDTAGSPANHKTGPAAIVKLQALQQIVDKVFT